jgi:hypothetical protein
MKAHQEADGAFFQVCRRLFSARVTGGELGLQNEAAELPVVHITARVQALGASVALVNHRASASYLIPHDLSCTLITCMFLTSCPPL